MNTQQLNIGGFQKNSLIDYPGKISCVIFFSGCNFICPYCHNPSLLKENTYSIPTENIYEFLKIRKGLIDAVVISGGEPTLQKELFSLCKTIKEMGFLIKLDTNGSHPQVIKTLMENHLLDYIAMDIKSDPLGPFYSFLIPEYRQPDAIMESVDLIMKSDTDYEFRTTCVRPFVDKHMIENITRDVIHHANLYVLQEFHHTEILNPLFFKNDRDFYCLQEIKVFQTIAEQWVRKCVVR
jgi:pyruvate formate lyase activating enzyme